ncbi:MAG: SIS domain-containing protein [Phycisphaerales bacterium]|nr:MAG: SIS domain-containing protein [Phycisphaerales bacterium]
MNSPQAISERMEGTINAIHSLRDQLDEIVALGQVVVECLQKGGTLYTCGNGGSAAEAMHLAEELIGRYRGQDRPARRAMCLNADVAAMTCIANDFGYEQVFSRQVEGMLGRGDVLVVLSTSGNSENIVKALMAAKANGAKTIGLLGRGGGKCLAHCDHAIIVAGEDSAHIQEGHLVVVHLICEAVEQAGEGLKA